MAIDTEKRNKRQYQWQKENTDRINFTMPKGTKEDIQAAAAADKINPAEWIRQAINEKLNHEGVKDPPEIVPELNIYAKQVNETPEEYIKKAIWERMRRQDQEADQLEYEPIWE